MPSNRPFGLVVGVASAVVLALMIAACGSDSDQRSATADDDALCGVAPSAEPVTAVGAATEDTSITVIAHDAFAVSDEVLAAFEEETGIGVEVLTSNDAGTMVAQAIQTADDPVADVMFGVDNTFLCRAIDADLFVPYEAVRLADVPSEFLTDPAFRVTPIDFGDVCINSWNGAYSDRAAPGDLDALTDPDFERELVVQNPETSSPGFAFLLATIERYGDGWEDFWSELRENGVAVTSGWTEAYYTEFAPYGGDRPLVVSYASSPVAEVIFADPPTTEAPTAVMEDSCFRQIEYAGVLNGTDKPEAAAAFVEFMLSDTFQEDVPLNMFVFPVSSTADLPPEFEEYAELPEAPATMDPQAIEQGRLDWTDRWVEIVLR